MATEFVLRIKRQSFPEIQYLPDVFNQTCYNGNKHVYLTSRERIRVKVEIVKVAGEKYELSGYRWTQFCLAFIPMDAETLHFVQEGDDSYYVTNYDASGYETGGYDAIVGRPSRYLSRIFPQQNMLQRIPSDFLPGLKKKDNIKISANKRRYTIYVRREKVKEKKGRYEYVVSDVGWQKIVERFQLRVGEYVVFMRERNNYLRLQAFNMHGSPITVVHFLGATKLRKHQPELDFWEQADERMRHKCFWERHMDHFGEKTDCFYVPYEDTIDRQRLEQLHERDTTIMELQRTLDYKDKELHAIRL